MKVEQITWSAEDGWNRPAALAGAQLVLVFGDQQALTSAEFNASLATRWPAAAAVGCSTAGQIRGTDVFDDGAVATAIEFAHTRVKIATAHVTAADSAVAGASLAQELAAPGLVHVLIISEGLDINARRWSAGSANIRNPRSRSPAACRPTANTFARRWYW